MDDTTTTTTNVGAEEEDFATLFESMSKEVSIKEGDIVKGTVLSISKDHVLIDVGYKSEGLVPVDEFMDDFGTLLIKAGDEVEVYLDAIENEDGLVELSKDKADKLRIWDRIAKAAESNELVEGTIIGRVKGGLTVDIGVKAFLPGSQIDLRPVRNLEQFIGQRFQFKVIKFNKRRGNIVLSRRALLEKEREKLKTETLKKLKVGQIIDGIVKNITEYGCFVDLGGIDGLLHITDMSWGRVNHPSEMFEVGDEIKVKILKFEPETERVSLGLKQITEDPWVHVDERFNVSDRVQGRVVSLTDYGAFVELDEGIEGLVHISEMSWTKRVKHPSKMVSIGDIVEAVILDIDTENKRISLGMKQVEENPWYVLREKYAPGTRLTAPIRNITNFGLFLGIEEGIDGLVHISDLSWSGKIKNPADHYKKGDEVDAVVLSIDPEKERFSLGIKQLTPDPWLSVHQRYPIGSVVEGKVVKVLDFGCIIELESELEGLIHISELSSDKVEKVSSVVKEGDVIKAKVINLLPEDRKIGLSIRQVSDDEASEAYQKFAQEQKPRRPSTLGELIANKIDMSSLPANAAEAKARKEQGEPEDPEATEEPTADEPTADEPAADEPEA